MSVINLRGYPFLYQLPLLPLSLSLVVFPSHSFPFVDTEQTLNNVQVQGEVLDACLAELQDHAHVGDIRRLGLMAAVELVPDRLTQAAYPWPERRGWRACQAALEHNVWLRPLGNVIVIMPPLCCQREHIEQIARAVMHGVQEATRKA